MGNPILQLANAANWQEFYTTNAYAEVLLGGLNVRPIPPIVVPLQFEYHVIAVYVTCNTAKANWFFGGYLSQKINLGLTVGGIPSVDSVQKRKLYLNRLTLLIFPKLSGEYSIEIEPPRWFRHCQFTVWQYIGINEVETDNLIASMQDDIDEIKLLLGELNAILGD